MSHALPDKRRFDAGPLVRLRGSRPDFVMIGDSLLNAGLDPARMAARLGGGQRVENLWNGGAESACWYLLLKNYVVASGVRPRRVCIFFNDRLLTYPDFRTQGSYRRYIESIMHADEPGYRAVLGDDSTGRGSRLEAWATRLFPLNARRHVHEEKIEKLIFRAVAFTPPAAAVLESQVNATFDLAKLRGETMERSLLVTADEAVFDPAPGHSFLPLIVGDAARAGIPLCFVRVKRHPAADGRMPQSEPLRRYIADLRAWLESRGCVVVDCADDPGWTADMYQSPTDDHIGPWARERSTDLYADKLRPVLSPPPAPAT